MVMSVAAIVPRNYVVMEVKENLVAADRAASVKQFKSQSFRRIAKVMMGEPPADFKLRVHAKVLEEKQKRCDNEWRKKKADQERKRMLKKKQKEADEKKRAAAEEIKKKREAIEAKRKEMLTRAREIAATKKKEEEEKKKAAEGEGN